MKRKSNSIHDDVDFCVPAEPIRSSEYADGSGAYVDVYSRAQALSEGVLIDATNIAKKAGVTCSVAFTAAAWLAAVDDRQFGPIESNEERVLEVLRTLRGSSRKGNDTAEFVVVLSREDGNLCRVFLRAICGPGDDISPVLTIFLLSEF